MFFIYYLFILWFYFYLNELSTQFSLCFRIIIVIIIARIKLD